MFRIRYPEELPVTAKRTEILTALQNAQVVIVAGETGSGKTTQLPKICLEAGLAEHGKIGCTQPRRVAALSISRRVAEELGVAWGREVGCKMRFADDTVPETRIKFMTDGILLAELQSDPELSSYSAIIIDEAHERSLNIDFLLGHLTQLLKRRLDLKLVVTSATIDTKAFSEAFNHAPIIEVSGRTYPVEIRYRPTDSFPLENEADGPSHVINAVQAVEESLLESSDGDILVFMPTERDIRETRDLLEARLGRGTEVLTLFGRMASADQQRIFAPGLARRVIVSTNVAETSLTLPRIRYVIDSGLARVSRYNPRTRTRRLPVEDISQSSANQRAGRAGRIRDGIAIRLYSEDDFEKRVPFTQPEIQRANLAEVILRMKAFGLGEIETFPFLSPPQTAAIRSGYRLLHELGALNETNHLTGLGLELARLPLDPTLGRMLLQAREERTLPEVLIIAAGLSIPDPRERPEDAVESARTAHQRFEHPLSDFLTLLNLWRSSPEETGRSSNNALRKFCKQNFLSFNRMREWRDLRQQLAEVFPENESRLRPEIDSPAPHQAEDSAQRAKQNTSPIHAPLYRGVHRAILTGLLGHLCKREERNRFKASGNRILTLFPGSSLFHRNTKADRKPNRPSDPKPTDRSKSAGQPEWIMAAEVVETSQLFARTNAAIDPLWATELGSHLCESRFTEPHWNRKAERVLTLERVLLQGMELSRKHSDYGKVNPEHAKELFIRSALVAGDASIPLNFPAENLRTREKVENGLTRVRHHRALDLDETLYAFYNARLPNISSIHDLLRFARPKCAQDKAFCVIHERDLLGQADDGYDASLFPDQVAFGNTVIPLHYRFKPGEETDGVTLTVPLPVAPTLSDAQIKWMVPGLRSEIALYLLRALPKSVRREISPIEEKAEEIARLFNPGRENFFRALADFVTRSYRVSVNPEVWFNTALPSHLTPRIEVVDRENRAVAAGRDLSLIQKCLDTIDHRTSAWTRLAHQSEKTNLKDWDFGDVPESITVEIIADAAVLAFPGLQVTPSGVDLRLFKKATEAESHTPRGIRKLAENTLLKDLNHLRRELINTFKNDGRTAKTSQPLRLGLENLTLPKRADTPNPSSPEALADSALSCILDFALVWNPPHPMRRQRFLEFTETARKALPKLAYQLGESIRAIRVAKDLFLQSKPRYRDWEADLARLVPENICSSTPFHWVHHLPRFIKAMQVRAERAVLKPLKDAERLKSVQAMSSLSPREGQEERFRWMLEEFRVSIFAQELGTSESVSETRLRELAASTAF
jgi:ATP-dependent helicase HrpA